MMSRSGSKLRKGVGTKDGDIITELPDCVLSRILSCLPTKDAVRTSVLSRAWEYKWTSIFNIEIDDRMLFSTKKLDEACFVEFMDWILLNIHNVRSCCFSFHHEYGKSHIRRWISAVFRRNVERLEVDEWHLVDPRSISLSLSLLSCTSLRELKINMSCTLKAPGNICFPNLTKLILHGVWIMNVNSCTDTLTCTFPLLETLELHQCKWLNARFVEIHAPELSLFILEPPDDTVDYHCIIKFVGMRLAKFKAYGCASENFLLIGSTVAHVTIKHDDSVDEIKAGVQVRRLLKEFSCLEELKISCDVVQAIGRTKSGLPLPRFDKLGRLCLSDPEGFGDDISNIEGLFEVLQLAPKLRFLAIYMSSFFPCGYEGEYDYEGMESVPSCILSRLEEIKLDCFTSTAPELYFATFLLKVCAKLKKLSVSPARRSQVDGEVRRHLLGFPPASTCLTIDIMDPMYPVRGWSSRPLPIGLLNGWLKSSP